MVAVRIVAKLLAYTLLQGRMATQSVDAAMAERLVEERDRIVSHADERTALAVHPRTVRKRQAAADARLKLVGGDETGWDGNAVETDGGTRAEVLAVDNEQEGLSGGRVGRTGGQGADLRRLWGKISPGPQKQFHPKLESREC